jgi:hypothetical protein
MDRLAGSWNGKRGGRKVERFPLSKVVASVAVEARWGSSSGINLQDPDPEFR